MANLFSRMLRRFEHAGTAAGARTGRNQVRVATPHLENALRSVAYADIFGAEHVVYTRDQAMQLPAVGAARWLICWPLSRQPLVQYDAFGRMPEQPRWLLNTGGLESWQFRTADTLDDLMFEGWSLWRVERSTSGDGWETDDGTFVPAITGAVRVPLDRWDFTADDEVQIDGEIVDVLDVILFRSPTDPFLISGRTTLRGARTLEDKWLRALNAIATMEIRQTEDIELADPDDEDADPDARQAMGEVQAIVDDYVKGRLDENGAVVFTPYGYALESHAGEVPHELFVEGRNFQVLDVARHLALPGQLLNASAVSASLTYETKQGGRSDFRDLVQVAWATAMEAPLSTDLVCPPGQRISFDLSDLAERPDDGQAPATED